MAGVSKKLMQRIISGVILSAVTFYVVYTGGLAFSLYLLIWGCVALFEWLQVALATPHRAKLTFFGIVYVPLAFLCCHFIREDFSLAYALMLAFMIWSSDVGAYIFGKVIGGAKMAEKLSPKKTWAGLFGALLSPAVAGLLFLFFFLGAGEHAFSALHISAFSVFGALMGLIGQMGDLLVSFLKRQAGVKDTGSIIPGHGGVLDRIDSMLLAAPVFLLVIKAFGHVFVF